MSARPVGDPAALQAAAAAVLAIAGKLEGVDSEIGRALPGHAYEGPGRCDHDTALRSAAQSVGHSVERLQRLAGQLGRGAGDLRRAQHTWDVADAERREREAERCTPTPRAR